jgi:glutathione S-transferase
VSAPYLYHLALAEDWRRARSTGTYSGSTIGRTLDQEGFVHCSFAHQVRSVADRYYRNRADVVLLRIDPALLESEVRIEPAGSGPEGFPHVYGPIPVRAVVSADPVGLEPDGRLRLPDLP